MSAGHSDGGGGLHPRAAMFQNRLRKNLKRLEPWARQRDIEAYRLYDRDIPEVGLVVDRYGERLVVWEYARRAVLAEQAARAPETPEEELPHTADQARFLDDVVRVLVDVCGVPEERVYFKHRFRQRGATRYQRIGTASDEFVVREGGHRFLVNLSDYLDTGLFLDHRETRALVQELAADRRVLNLFAYTGSFTVYAAGGGARSSVTMDLSNTYLDWAGRNFAQNGLDPRRHRLVRTDVLAYLHEPHTVPEAAGPFDLIVLDPPTFSNSKKMRGTLDVLRDHPRLLRQALRLLAPGGVLLFSCNHHGFVMRPDEIGLVRGSGTVALRDLSEQTLPRDFHDPRTHRCFLFTAPAEQHEAHGEQRG